METKLKTSLEKGFPRSEIITDYPPAFSQRLYGFLCPGCLFDPPGVYFGISGEIGSQMNILSDDYPVVPGTFIDHSAKLH